MTDEAPSQPTDSSLPQPTAQPHPEPKPPAGHKQSHSAKSARDYFPLALAGILLISTLFTFFFILPAINRGPQTPLTSPTPFNNATPLPIPKLSALSLVVTDCPECSGTLGEIARLEQNGAEVNNTNVNYNSSKGQELISKYGIKKVPALIVSGEISAPQVKTVLSEMGNASSDAVVVQDPLPVYVDLSTGKKVGLISLWYVKSNECSGCSDFSPLIDEMRGVGMAITDTSLLQENSSEAQKLITQYNITKLPVLVLSKDAAAYKSFAQAWPQIGSVEADGTFVLRKNAPPYYDLLEKKLYGAVNITYLNDRSCVQCYNATLHDSVLERVGVFLKTRNYVDVNDVAGKVLVAKYNLTYAPTMILSKEFGEYKAFIDRIWSQVGTVEADGYYVFRNMEALGNVTYKNLKTGQVLGPGITATTPTPAVNVTATPQANRTSSPTPQANVTVTPAANATATPAANATVKP